MPDLLAYRDARTILDRLPYPLELTAGMYLRRKELRELAPAQRAELPEIDLPGWAWGLREAVSSAMKVVTLVALADYLRLPAEARERRLNARIVRTLAGAPTEAGWLILLDELLELLDEQEQGSIFPPKWLEQVTVTGTSLRGDLHELVAFRNQVAHGNFAWEDTGALAPGGRTVAEIYSRKSAQGAPDPPIGPAEIPSVELRLDALFAALDPSLGDWLLLAGRDDGPWHLARGASVLPAEPQPDLPSRLRGQCVLARGEEVVPLHPWALLKRTEQGERVEFSELPLFDKLAATDPEFLAYAEGELYREAKLRAPAYGDLRRLMQELEAASVRDWPDVFPWAELLERPPLFVGREGVLGAVRTHAEQGHGYGLLRAVAGQGKTAILAELYRQVREGEAEGPLWLWHFCARGENRDSGYRFLRSVLAQLSEALEDGFPRDLWETRSLDELRDQLGGLLEQAASAAGRRIALVVDAIDEAAAGGGYSIPELLPYQLPDGVVAVLSVRCAADGTTDVDLRRLRPQHDLLGAPMAGLAEDDVRELLAHAAGAPVPELVLSKVYRASVEGNALFVHFVAEDIRAGEIDPENPADVPERMDDYFDAIWDGLPAEHGLLAHRLLMRLAILQEPVSDAFLAGLVGEPVENVEASRAHLGKWLSLREQEGGLRCRLFHNLFVDYVLGTMRPGEVRELHAALVEHCLGRWEPERQREDFRPQSLVPDEALLYALGHLPHHEVEAELWDEAYETLTDFRFLEAKAMHVAVTTLPDETKQYGGVYVLQEDYRRVLAAMP